jgi:uncharacterized protein (TIGR02646 family)
LIQIDRSRATSPESLLLHEEAELERLRTILGKRALTTHDFDRGIYAAREVRDLLWDMQHAKCCYCEREYERKYSDVEHFRPKARAVRDDGKPDAGYWWLAYRFDNLYFACAACNRPKSDRFPLRDRSAALKPGEGPRSREEGALLLDPAFDPVEEHLTFVWVEDQGFRIAPRNLSERGKATIAVLGLDRDDLVELRRKYYHRCLEPVIVRYGVARRSGDERRMREVRAEASRLAAPEQPHTLLARAAFREAGLL